MVWGQIRSWRAQASKDSPVRLCWDPGALLRLGEHVNPGCTRASGVCDVRDCRKLQLGQREKLVGREQQGMLVAP